MQNKVNSRFAGPTKARPLLISILRREHKWLAIGKLGQSFLQRICGQSSRRLRDTENRSAADVRCPDVRRRCPFCPGIQGSRLRVRNDWQKIVNQTSKHRTLAIRTQFTQLHLIREYK
jgi:hypothetical protein